MCLGNAGFRWAKKQEKSCRKYLLNYLNMHVSKTYWVFF